MKLENITYSIPWNLFLITLGSVIIGIGLTIVQSGSPALCMASITSLRSA